MRFIGRMPHRERQENCVAVPVCPLDRSRLSSVPGTVVVWTLTLVACLPAFAESAATPETTATTSTATPQLVNSPMRPAAPDYSKSTDHELTRLGARWDRLSAPEREALLREVKLRMAQRKDADGVLVIRTQRRYGRVYNGNGRYLKIETKVVQVRPSNDRRANTAGFGTGFEQRNAESDPLPGPVQGDRNGAAPSSPLDSVISPPQTVMRASDSSR